jgi:Fe-S cluster biosynthesis and repair protein YggX
MPTYIYEVEMLKLSDKIEVLINAEDDNARDAFFRKFLMTTEERFFFDKNTNKGYSKEYIYGYTIKGVK